MHIISFYSLFISVSPRETFFFPDRNLETQEYLYCMTSANPRPQYTFCRNGEEIQSGPSSGLKLTYDMVSDDVNMSCVVTNILIDGQSTNDTTWRIITITGKLTSFSLN